MPQTQPPKKSRGRRVLIILLTLIPPLLILMLRPLGFSLQQSGILAALVLTILWWVTGAVERTIASVFLLAVFLLGSGAPPTTVFSFPLSENFVMIAVSFLFSQGISNSGLPGRLLQPLLSRFAHTPLRMMIFLILSAAVSMFIIPQPFSRIIILSLIYREYFTKINLPESLSAVLMLGLYVFSVLINTSMTRGDIILNGSLTSMAGQTVGEGAWVAYMAVPTLAYLLAAAVLYWLLFRGVLRTFPSVTPANASEKISMSRTELRNLIFLAAVVVLWATEDFHPITGTVVVVAATVLMFPLGMLRLPDFRAINVKLLVFLTAAFAIGGTLKACGVADRLFALFLPIFPDTFSQAYVLVVLVTCVLLHTVLGSNITTMSVVVPGLMSIGAGVAPPLPLMFIMCIAVCSQFILPFHHVILLLGEGNRYYSTKELVKVGLPHTVLMFAAVFLFYLPWWHLIGAL